MTLLTVLSPEAEAAANNHGRADSLKKLLSKIEDEQSLVLLSPFSDRRFFNKRLGRDFRVLFSRHVQGDYTPALQKTAAASRLYVYKTIGCQALMA